MLNRLLLVLAILMGGCSTRHETFAGHDADQVWTAMLAVARTPNYSVGPAADRWTVRENDVWVDENSNRIEIFRRLERILHQPASRPQHQDRTWKFQLLLEQREPPAVMFRSRNLGVPSHSWDEADRFFAEVRDVLSGSAPPPEKSAVDAGG